MMSAGQILAQTRSFDLDAGDANVTLREFARQARVSIVIDREDGQGVQTNEVLGLLEIQAALERMLEGTPLVFKQDLETGAFAVTRSISMTGAPLTQPSETPGAEMTDTKATNNLFRTIATLFTLGIAGSPASTLAQESDESSDIYQLSPFTVDESEDVGYSATSTLAGTRIRSDLRDLGAAISVITAEFMEDTGATDAATLLSYTTNTEVGGMQGNYSGATDFNDSRFFQPDDRTNPQFNQRVRGLGKAALTRDLFLTDIPFDSYNTSRVEINRGPNSLLFGIGDPGGVINNGLKQAFFDTEFGEFIARIGSHGSWRSEIDLNRELVEDRVALRIAALHEDETFKQKPAWEKDQRLYAASEIVLLQNQESSFLDQTRLKLNGEIGQIEGSPVEIIPPSRAYDNWYEPFPRDYERFTGVTPFATVMSPQDGGTWEFQETYNPFLANTEPQINTNVHPAYFRRIPIIFNRANADVATIGLSGTDPQGEVSDLSQLQGYEASNNWRTNLDTVASAGLAGTPGVAPLVGDGDPATTPLGQHLLFAANSPFGEAYSGGFAVPSIQNRDVFDYRNLLYSGGIDYRKNDFWAQNYALEQTFMDNTFGVEISYNSQRYESHQDFFFSGGDGTSTTGPYDIQVDIAEFLANGLPNPNLGRAYTRVSGTNLRNSQWDRETTRATAFADLDFKEIGDGLNWLGRHRFTGLFSDRKIDQFDEILYDVWRSETEDIAGIANNTVVTNGRRRLNTAVYVSQPLLGTQSINDVRLEQIQIKRPQPGEEYTLFYANANESDPIERRIQSGPFQIDRIIRDQDVQRQEIESKALAWQSYLLDDHIVGLFGWREDESRAFERQSEAELGFQDSFSDGTFNPAAALLSEQPVFVETGETITWSIVGRFPEKWLGELPWGSDFQLHYNKSENFNPIGLRNDTLGRPIPQPTGETEEYGFTWSLGEKNQYVVKVNWFETSINNRSAGGLANPAGEATFLIEKYLSAELDGTPFEDARVLVDDPSDSPIFTYQQFYDAMLNALPGDLRGVINPRFEDRDGDGQVDEFQIDPIDNLSATSDRAAEGFEFELVGNPTNNWRFIWNVSRQETVQTNTAVVNAAATEAFFEGIVREGLFPLQNAPGASSGGTLEMLGANIFQDTVTPIRAVRAQDGTVSNEQREWRVTAVNSYEFTEGVLSGFSLGGAVRWQSKAATGFEFFVQDGAPIPNLDKPFFDDGLFNGDIWLSYGKPIFQGVDWKIQLNVRNAFGDNDDIPVKTNPDGRVAVIRIPNPTTWYLTNSFRF